MSPKLEKVAAGERMRANHLAERVEKLTAERDRYKAALEKLADDFGTHNRHCGERATDPCSACIARNALAGERAS